MDYKYCPKCGQKLAINDRFCPNCGTKQPMLNQLDGDSQRGANTQSENGKQNPGESKNSAVATQGTVDQSQEGHQSLTQNDNRPVVGPTVSHTSSSNDDSGQVTVDNRGVTDGEQTAEEATTEKNADSDERSRYQTQFYQQVPNSQSANSHNSNQGAGPSRDWQPYNQSGHPGLVNSFKVWIAHPFRKLNDCMGRADFWWGYLAFLILYWLLLALVALVVGNGNGYSSPFAGPGNLVFVVLSIISEYFQIIACIERLHDTGHSGWNYCWTFTGIGSLYVLYLLVQPSNWDQKRWQRIN